MFSNKIYIFYVREKKYRCTLKHSSSIKRMRFRKNMKLKNKRTNYRETVFNSIHTQMLFLKQNTRVIKSYSWKIDQKVFD